MKHALTRSALAAGVVALALGLAASAYGARARPRGPEVTIRALWAPRIHLIAFAGDLIPRGSTMVSTASFRVLARRGGRFAPVTVWMALITGEGARWRANGSYHAALMRMEAPMAPGTYRVELRATDSDGGVTQVFSGPVRVP